MVNEDELVAAVIDTALKSYAREGRLLILGSDLNTFILYCPITGTEGIRSITRFICFVLLIFYAVIFVFLVRLL